MNKKVNNEQIIELYYILTCILHLDGFLCKVIRRVEIIIFFAMKNSGEFQYLLGKPSSGYEKRHFRDVYSDTRQMNVRPSVHQSKGESFEIQKKNILQKYTICFKGHQTFLNIYKIKCNRNTSLCVPEKYCTDLPIFGVILEVCYCVLNTAPPGHPPSHRARAPRLRDVITNYKP